MDCTDQSRVGFNLDRLTKNASPSFPERRPEDRTEVSTNGSFKVTERTGPEVSNLPDASTLHAVRRIHDVIMVKWYKEDKEMNNFMLYRRWGKRGVAIVAVEALYCVYYVARPSTGT